MSFENTTEEVVTSVVGPARVGKQQPRRNGDRDKNPSRQSLYEFDCGCDDPSVASVPHSTSRGEYIDFIKLGRELKPRHKENGFC